MRRLYVLSILLAVLTIAVSAQKQPQDYVPDSKTAERIADAVLTARYGDQGMNKERALIVDGSNKDYWVVQRAPRENSALKLGGEGPAVWINKHSGCLKIMEHMK
jgi:hypothetical protein